MTRVRCDRSDLETGIDYTMRAEPRPASSRCTVSPLRTPCEAGGATCAALPRAGADLSGKTGLGATTVRVHRPRGAARFHPERASPPPPRGQDCGQPPRGVRRSPRQVTGVPGRAVRAIWSASQGLFRDWDRGMQHALRRVVPNTLQLWQAVRKARTFAHSSSDASCCTSCLQGL